MPILDIARRRLHHCVCVLGFSNAASEAVYTRLGRFRISDLSQVALMLFLGKCHPFCRMKLVRLSCPQTHSSLSTLPVLYTNDGP